MNDKMNFYLPEFFYNYDMNMAFAQLLQSNPELFYEDVKIAGVYGCFPTSIWNGGRVMVGNCSKENMKNTIKAFNDMGVGIRYTFTNCLLKNGDLNDRFCNLEMELLYDAAEKAGDKIIDNEVIVNSEMLADYIGSIYPGIPLISSTTKRLTDDQEVKDEVNNYRYRLVVLDYNYNNEDKLFEGWFAENSDKFEILLNAYCQDNCPARSRHYRQLSFQQLNFNEDTPDFQGCCHIGDDFYTVMETRKRFVTVEDLHYGKYRAAGYRNFKIEGRTNDKYDVLESYIYYMIRPEYRDKVRLKALKAIFERRPQNG
jgi:hypothetical protein